MTREPDHRAENNPAAGAKTRRLTPTSVQITMPDQDQEPKNQPARPIESIEGMLGRLLDRLDDNDQRYGTALDELNQRLNDLSLRTQNTDGTANQTTGDSLERLRNQATVLAAQVSEAGHQHQPHTHETAEPRNQRRMGRYANDDRPVSDLGDSRLNANFADVTQRLEKTLSTQAPASQLDHITQSLDDLGTRLDGALSRQSGAAALQSIEEQLRALSAGFGEARKNHARVEAIEQNLSSLMNWAQASGGQTTGHDATRLDSIEQTLRDLDSNARDMDARTITTLEAMNDALHSIASNSRHPEEHAQPAVSRNSHSHSDGGFHAPGNQAAPAEPVSEVWIEDGADAEFTTGSDGDQTAEIEAQLGASIPDFQPAPGRISPRHGNAERVEPTFDGKKNDFIESARRAAAAAAQEPVQSSPRAGLSKRLAATLAKSRGDDAGKPRRILYVLAAGLMLTSAGLMYARMQNSIDTTVPAIGEHEPSKPETTAPSSPAKKPDTSDQSSRNSSTLPAAAPVDKTSERIAPATPATEQRPVAQVSSNNTTPAPSNAVVKANGPISTATVLASLTPATTADQMAGVTINVTEPEHAPARRVQKSSSVAPLVPETKQTNAPAPLAQPRRVSKQASLKTRSSPAADTTRTDSSRGIENTVPSVGNLPTSSMPPARIGPNSLRVAAARGNPAAQVEVASRYAKGTGVPKDVKKASEWYGRAAAQGFAPAQYRLAALFERGQGVKKDLSIARTWYRRAAELGNVRAMHNLAVLYTRSGGNGPDYANARKWFYQAARYGVADSQFNLGILYDSGLGVKKNAAEAYKWFALAALQGDTEAGKRKDALRTRLPSRSLIAVEKTIRGWRALKPQDQANRTGTPRGGWQNASAKIDHRTADSARILRAQVLLNKLGYDAGAPDGKLGPQTTAAIHRFQARAGLSRTSGITPDMLQRLEALAG